MEYKLKEHFYIENTSDFKDTVKKIIQRFSMLGGLILNGYADIQKLWIKADRTELEFSGNTVTEIYHRIIRTIENADELEIVAKFSFEMFSETEIFLFTSEIAEYLDEMIDANGITCLDGLFYSLYDFTDEDFVEPISVTYGKLK